MASDDVVIYHNPSCSKSRSALEILQERGVEPTVVNYKAEPLDRATIERIVELVPDEPSALVRRDQNFKELGLDIPTTRAPRRWSTCSTSTASSWNVRSSSGVTAP